MNAFRCWACHEITDQDGECLNRNCPALRHADRARRLTREQLREIDRTINRTGPRVMSAEMV